jgi:hypothetical protein
VQGGALSSLHPDVRRDVVIAAIEDAGVKDLPLSPNGRHVVTDVMSYFFNSSAALDLAYHARIRRATCRALKGSEARPLSGD